MRHVIDLLQIDHRNMRQLLRVLEEEIDIYGASGVADFDLMKQIIDYTLHYPNLIHHPREDLLFRRLLARDPTSGPLIGDLAREHAELAQLTQRFAATLRQHIATEEKTLFPRVMAVFEDSDWAELDAFATTGYDPLFGSSIEKHYLDLHARIMQIRQADTYSDSQALEACKGKS
jgi:hemerythrin-like domain-containing protein